MLIRQVTEEGDPVGSCGRLFCVRCPTSLYRNPFPANLMQLTASSWTALSTLF